MASLSLLPKCAWGLNKELQRNAKPAVSVTATADMPCTELRRILESKLVKLLCVHNAFPQLELPDSIQSLELRRVCAPLLRMPPHLQFVTIKALSNSAKGVAALLNSLPDSVRHLSVGQASMGHWTWSGAGVDVALPPNLKTLKLSSVSFQRCTFPASLTSIHLRGCYLQVPHQLPESLTKARFESITLFPYPAAGFAFPLPRSLRHLQLQYWNPDWAIAPLPHALVHLSIAYETIRHHHHGLLTPTPAPLPHTLETLTVSTLGAETVHPILGRLPPRLSELNLQGAVTFDRALGPLPPSLTSLRLGRSFTQALGQLPDSLTELHVAHPYDHPSGDNSARSRFDRPLGRLPAAMQVLNLQYSVNFNHPLGCLPATLRERRLSRAYDHPLRTLPPALEVLVLGNEFQQELQLELPSTLRVFRMGERFNAPVVLPDALLELYIGGSYTHPLHLRPSLRRLHVGASYRHPKPPLPLTRKFW